MASHKRRCQPVLSAFVVAIRAHLSQARNSRTRTETASPLVPAAGDTKTEPLPGQNGPAQCCGGPAEARSSIPHRPAPMGRRAVPKNEPHQPDKQRAWQCGGGGGSVVARTAEWQPARGRRCASFAAERPPIAWRRERDDRTAGNHAPQPGTGPGHQRPGHEDATEGRLGWFLHTWLLC